MYMHRNERGTEESRIVTRIECFVVKVCVITRRHVQSVKDIKMTFFLRLNTQTLIRGMYEYDNDVMNEKERSAMNESERRIHSLFTCSELTARVSL